MSNEFDLWKRELEDLDLPTMPDDEVVSITTSDEDPIHRAIELQKYANSLRSDLYASTLFRGTSRLVANSHAFDNKQVEILAKGGTAIPERDPAFRKRSSTKLISFSNICFFRGSFGSIYEVPLIRENNQEKSHLVVKLLEPYVLDERSRVQEQYDLPDYLYVAATSIKKYCFLKNDQ